MSTDAAAGPIHAFLAGSGHDGSGRTLADIVAFDDARIEGVHDFVQWCFPLKEASQAVPGAPVLTQEEADAIRADPAAQEGLHTALARIMRFYGETDGWLRAHDHNHLRITRIITATRDLLGSEEARKFHVLVTERNRGFGSQINGKSLDYWKAALGEA